MNSAGQPWAEEMELNWSQMVIRDDLVSLRDFFKQGMQFSVVEEMVRKEFINDLIGISLLHTVHEVQFL